MPGTELPRATRYGNKYYMIPAKSLPLFDFVMSIGAGATLQPLVKPFVDLASPVHEGAGRPRLRLERRSR